jgi:peptidoglycan hydrolase-like protein with peptidoglycan-binding domain
MPLQSSILAGNARLEQAHAGGPSVKPGPPHDDVDAVRRIQRALVALGFSLPLSFPNGPNADPDGIYGSETRQAVVAFQKRAFPNSFSEWDGRTGTKTLTAMDGLLPAAGGGIVPAQFPVGDARLLLLDQVKRRIATRANFERDTFGCFQEHVHATRRPVGLSERVEPTDVAFTEGRISFKFWRGFNQPPSGDQPRFGGQRLGVIFRGAGAPGAESVGTFTTTQQRLMTKARNQGGVSQGELNNAGLIAWCGIFVLYVYRRHGLLKMGPWISGATLQLRTKEFVNNPDFKKHNPQIEFERVLQGEPLQIADFGILPGPEQHHVMVVGDENKNTVSTIEGNSTPTILREKRAAENPLSTIAARTRSRGDAVWFRPLWDKVLPDTLPTSV